MPSFKKLRVNPFRRDLIKQLIAIGAGGLIHPAFVTATNSNKLKNSLVSNSTWKDDEHYEALRKALNWQINTPTRYPDVIVQAQSEAEVQAAVLFATKNDLQIVCRSSGHNSAGAVLRNGGMLLDISALADISVNAAQKTALVQPGAKMYNFYQTLAAQQLIFPVADCHSVAMGGYLLGGGFSPVGYNWADGPACYSVISAELILANGKKVVVSKEENAELYWTIRGIGPGFFGVITRYQLKLYEHPKVILQSSFVYSLENLSSVLSFLDEMNEDKDERVEISIALKEQQDTADTIVAILKINVNINDSSDPQTEARALLTSYAESKLSQLAISRKEY